MVTNQEVTKKQLMIIEHRLDIIEKDLSLSNETVVGIFGISLFFWGAFTTLGLMYIVTEFMDIWKHRK